VTLLRTGLVTVTVVLAALAGCAGGDETDRGAGTRAGGAGTGDDGTGGAPGGSGAGGTASGGERTGGATSSGGAMPAGGATSGGASQTGGTGGGGAAAGGVAGATGGVPTEPETGGGGTGGIIATGGEGGATGGAVSGGSSSGGAPVDCVDEPPPNGDTCEHAVEWGWCDDAWMAGACALSCGRCEGGVATGGASTGGAATGGAATGGATTGGTATGGTSTGGAATGGESGGAVFPDCRFHFGTIDSFARDNAGIRAEVDYFTPGWMGQRDTFDMQYVCDEANPGGALDGILPVIVSYVIAFTARRDENLQDCNVGSPSLCDYGATYLRAHLEDRVLPVYSAYARGFAGCWGTTRPIVFLMEPDFYQYHAGGDPNSLSPAEAGQIMGRLVGALRAELPNAVFSLDISPWIPDQGAAWYSNFDLSLFTFVNTSGGGTDAGGERIRSNNDMTWAGVHGVTGKPILADTGYGVAGQSAGHDPAWDVAGNINARIADGVVGINQYNPNSSWGSTIAGLRSQLDPVPCP